MRSLPVMVALAALSTGVGGLAPAGAPAAAAESSQTTVVVSLAPRDPQRLAGLALVRPRRLSERIADLERVTPAPAARDATARWLAGKGFRVSSGGSPWLLTATTRSAAARRVLADDQVPAQLRDQVQAVAVAGRGHRWRHYALPAGSWTPSDLAQAYATPTGAQGAGTTVATVQFSGWQGLADAARGTGDLARYAAAAGLTLPAVTPVAVNSASVSRPQSPGDDLEVALDQQTLMAAAPAAAQRVYVTTNDGSGAVAVWDRVVADVRAGVPLTAVATSWGDCEQDIPRPELDAIHTRLQLLAALGVTVFAASGDNSTYDCPIGTPWQDEVSVDFPASSPAVVGVGGSRLTRSAGGWTETAWGGTRVDNQRGPGSGGGVSTIFARPAWQRGVGAGLPARRLVPDVATVGDPSTGVPVYWTGEAGSGPWWKVGGTSVGPPLLAGQYAATLAAQNRPGGAGADIHPWLYANASAFRDITSGTNHRYAATRGYDLVTGLGSPRWTALGEALARPALSAPPAVRTPNVPLSVYSPVGATYLGWAAGETGRVSCAEATAPTAPTSVVLPPGDRVSWITLYAATTPGSCVSATVRTTLDTRAPTAAAAIRRNSGTDTRLILSASSSDATPSSGVVAHQLALRRYVGSGSSPIWSATRSSPGTVHYSGRPGTTYRVLVRAVDRAGNASPWRASGGVTVPVDDRPLARTGAWSTSASSRAFLGRISFTAAPGATITTRVTGRQVQLLAARAPNSGYAALYVDGRYVRTVDLYQPSTRYLQLIPLTVWRSVSTHTVTVKVLGKHRAGARGSFVNVDGFLYW